VGGVVVLAVIAILLWYCVRKRRDDDFDGNFDPDRVVGTSPGRAATLPRLDLDVAPYSYNPAGSGATVTDYRNSQAPQMPVPQHSGYNMSQKAAAPAAFRAEGAVVPPGQYAQTQYSDPPGNRTSTTGSHYPTSPEHSLVGVPMNDFRNSSPGPSLGTSGTVPSAKEREMSRTMFVASGDGDTGSGSGGVIQHQDGGRVRLDRTPEERPQMEIPPSYDSIDPDDELTRG